MKGFNIEPDSTYFIDTKIRANHSFSFWDSVVAASALDCDADYLISEDMQDGFNLENKLTIISPFT